MREVAVLGIGQTPVSEHWEKSLRELAGDAALAALEDAGQERADILFVGNMMSGSANHQQHLGAYIADWIGLRGIEAMRLESACSSGAAAFRAGFLAVASGEVEIALVVGVEKMSDSPGPEITSALATAADAEWEVDQGVSFVALNAMLMRRYMHEFGWKRADFMPFAINAHANAAHNPNARLGKVITEKAYLHAPMVAEPVSVMDASPMGDGAAAVVLGPRRRLTAGRRAVMVAGSAAATDTLAVHSRRDATWLRAAEISAHKAYNLAGVGPDDVDLFELHDAFTIMSALSLEAAGFAKRGQGPRLGLDGEITLTGRVPVATRGGLKARGHPVGATGMYQLVEVVQQLRGEAGATQVDGARVGMAQNIGGSGSNIVTHILRTE